MENHNLDDRIYRDIEERLAGKEISAALKLGAIIKPQASAAHHFSTKGLPLYFCGDRSAKTVMVNLNPGKDAQISDDEWDKATVKFRKSSVEAFVGDFTNVRRDANDDVDPKNPNKLRYDEFDVKQAAFLSSWENNGINLPQNLDWSDRDICIEAKTKVISDKLQLELIPYASAKFDINTQQFKLLSPFVDTLLNEIFSREREYVIFASAVFEKIFKHYNKICPATFVLSDVRKTIAPLKADGKLKGKCRIVKINYGGKTQKALIAHTFPSQALCRAFDLMQNYGEFCYSVWKQK